MKKVSKVFIKILKGIGLLLVTALILLAISIPYGRLSEEETPEVGLSYQKLVLKGVHIIPMHKDTVLYNKNLYVKNNKIIAITSDSIVKEGFPTLHLKGKYIMPGLTDMHAHIFDRSDLPQYLSYGVTTVRNMMGFPMHLRWKKQLENNELIGSKLITASPTINSGNNVGSFHKKITAIDEIDKIVSDYIKEGYDFVKVYDDVDSLQMNAIEKIAKLNNVQIAGHPPKMSLEKLLKTSLASIEHTEELLKFLDKERSEASIKSLAKKIKTANSAVTLNLTPFYRINKIAQNGNSYFEHLQNVTLNPVIKFIGEKQLEVYTKAGPKYKEYAHKKYQTMELLSKTLNEEGVKIILGTDTGPNFIAAGASVIEEMNLLQKAGLSNYSILKSATYNAAENLNLKNRGEITINSNSDLLILNKNPLNSFETFKQPHMVITKNKVFSKKDLKALRTIGESKQNTYATIGFFLEHLLSI